MSETSRTRLIAVESTWQRTFQLWVMPLSALLIMVIALWFPMGLNIPDRAEGWTAMLAIDDPGHPINPQSVSVAGRPLGSLPWILGYALTPDSFLGVNLVHMLILFLKGAAIYALLRLWVPNSPAFALMTAALWVVFPGDVGSLDTRIPGFQLSVTSLVLALWSYYQWWIDGKRYRILWVWFFLALCLLIHDSAYPLIAVAPLLLYTLRKGTRRTFLTALLVWYPVPLVTAIQFLVLLLTRQLGYTGNLIAFNSIMPFDSPVVDMFMSIMTTYQITLIQGWAIADLPRILSPLYLGLTVGSMTVMGVVSFHLYRRFDQGSALKRDLLIRVVSVGLVIILLGFLMYVPTVLRWGTWRVYILSGIGAVLCVSGAIFAVAAKLPLRYALPRLIPLLLLIAIGMLKIYAINAGNAENARFQLALLSALGHQAPNLSPETMIIVLKTEARDLVIQRFNGTSVHFEDAVRFMYRDASLHFTICNPFDTQPYGKGEQCSLKPEAVILNQMGEVISHTYDQVIFMSLQSDGTLTLNHHIPFEFNPEGTADQNGIYAPKSRIINDQLPSQRMQRLLGDGF